MTTATPALSHGTVDTLLNTLASIREAKRNNRAFGLISTLAEMMNEDADRVKLRVLAHWTRITREEEAPR
jgi:hypothetical protein